MQEIQNLTCFWSSVHAQFKISFFYYSTKGAHLIRWIWKRWHSRSLQKLFSYTIPWEYLKGLWGHSFKNVTAAQKSKKEISELLSKYFFFLSNCTFLSICRPFWVGVRPVSWPVYLIYHDRKSSGAVCGRFAFFLSKLVISIWRGKKLQWMAQQKDFYFCNHYIICETCWKALYSLGRSPDFRSSFQLEMY